MRPFAEWLVASMTRRKVGPRQVAIGMKARGYQVSRSAVSAYALDQVVPPMEKAEAFAAYFEAEEADVLDLIRRSRSSTSARAVGDAGAVLGVPADIHAFIRLTAMEVAQRTAEEMIDRMSRRRDRVPPESDPEIVAMVAEINAELAKMTLAQIEEARHCFREELHRHRQAEGKRLQS